MTDIDQLGSFYLGRPYDLKSGKTEPEALIYDSDDLTTHAVCVGMTGSGKTGLCLSLLEEADRLRRAQARLGTQRWQFFARLGSILWVIVDTVMSVMGKGLPGRRRSLDPAFRSAATERGQQSGAQISVDAAQKEKDRLEHELQDKLKSLEADLSHTGVRLEPIELKSQKGDLEVDQVSLVWLPWRIDASGHAEPVY